MYKALILFPLEESKTIYSNLLPKRFFSMKPESWLVNYISFSLDIQPCVILAIPFLFGHPSHIYRPAYSH